MYKIVQIFYLEIYGYKYGIPIYINNKITKSFNGLGLYWPINIKINNSNNLLAHVDSSFGNGVSYCLPNKQLLHNRSDILMGISISILFISFNVLKFTFHSIMPFIRYVVRVLQITKELN